MISSSLLILLGLLTLLAGGDVLLRGAVGAATLLRLTPAVIGLTVVAVGTSVPELAVSMIAMAKGNTDIGVGNVVGSNIFNSTCILGLAALIAPLAISGGTVRHEYPVLALATLACVICCRDGSIDRLEGFFFVTAYFAFTAYVVRLVRREVSSQELAGLETEIEDIKPVAPSRTTCAVFLIGGTALLGLGAHWTVSGAVDIALALGLSERIVGLTIVATGTSLPEVVTSVVSSIKGRDDIAVANVIGSNIFNLLGILGLTSLVRPIPVEAAIISGDSWWMLGVTALLFPLMFTGKKITRAEGGLLLGVYGTYMTLLLTGA